MTGLDEDAVRRREDEATELKEGTLDPNATRPQESGPTSEGEAPRTQLFERLIRINNTWRLMLLCATTVGLLLGIAAAIALCYFVVPFVWHWSIQAYSSVSAYDNNGDWPPYLYPIPGFVGLIMVGAAGFWAIGLPVIGLGKITSSYLDDEESRKTKILDQVSDKQKTLEDELLPGDQTGLVQLLRYSRAQLEAYYKMALEQTGRSFRYSILAMWLGFMVLLSGVVYHILPSGVGETASTRPELKLLFLIGGGIIEIISALFLWVYRSSILQLTYFYDRQMYSHAVLLGTRIAAGMTEGGDAARKSIIDKLLERNWAIDRPAPPSSKGMAELISKK